MLGYQLSLFYCFTVWPNEVRQSSQGATQPGQTPYWNQGVPSPGQNGAPIPNNGLSINQNSQPPLTIEQQNSGLPQNTLKQAVPYDLPRSTSQQNGYKDKVPSTTRDSVSIEYQKENEMKKNENEKDDEESEEKEEDDQSDDNNNEKRNIRRRQKKPNQRRIMAGTRDLHNTLKSHAIIDEEDPFRTRPIPYNKNWQVFSGDIPGFGGYAPQKHQFRSFGTRRLLRGGMSPYNPDPSKIIPSGRRRLLNERKMVSNEGEESLNSGEISPIDGEWSLNGGEMLPNGEKMSPINDAEGNLDFYKPVVREYV